MNVFVAGEINDSTGKLLPEEAQHCHRVLRKKEGDEIVVIDGIGGFYRCIILHISKNSCEFKVIRNWEESKRPYYLHIAMAPTKSNSRFEWFIEKAIEIGVDEISPVLCEHAERKKLNVERIRRIAVSAVKQSLSASFPLINEMVPLTTLLDRIPADHTRMVSHLSDQAPHLKNALSLNGRYTIIVGPEGDFSVSELEKCREKGWEFAMLGNKRLRTETAGMVIAQVVSGLHF